MTMNTQNFYSDKNNDYTINTGHVYSCLLDNWQQLDRSFLQKDIEEAFVTTLAQKKVFHTDSLPVENREKEVQRLSERFNAESKFIKDYKDAFPLVGFHTINNNGQTEFVDFDAACVLALEDPFFPLFFSLQLFFTDVLETHAFLNYHFVYTFGDDSEALSEFISNCGKKYPQLYTEVRKDEIGEFISSLTKQKAEESTVEALQESTVGDGFTNNRKILFLHYLFETLGANNNSSVLERARVVQGITGLQLLAKDIKNTDIYKRLSNPLKDNTKGGFQQDLIFVRNLFERLGLHEISSVVSKDIPLNE